VPDDPDSDDPLPTLEEARRRFEVYSAGLLAAFQDLRAALGDFHARYPDSVELPAMKLRHVPKGSSMASFLRFMAKLSLLVSHVDDVPDRNVAAARINLLHHCHLLCEAVADVEDLASRDDL
jgi:hypothetical protein